MLNTMLLRQLRKHESAIKHINSELKRLYEETDNRKELDETHSYLLKAIQETSALIPTLKNAANNCPTSNR